MREPGVKIYTRALYGAHAYRVESGSRALLIDPGGAPPDRVLADLHADGLTLDWIILTHEHFDHIEGSDAIRDATGACLVCSAACAAAIVDAKKNLSAFFPDSTAFSLRPPDRIWTMESGFCEMPWAGGTLVIEEAPGHSPGGVIVRIGSMLFTGDTLLTDNASPTRLPGGDRKALALSLARIESSARPGDVVYPGHGPSLPFEVCARRWIHPPGGSGP